MLEERNSNHTGFFGCAHHDSLVANYLILVTKLVNRDNNVSQTSVAREDAWIHNVPN